MKFNVIITGSSGMVGKGVLLECLESPFIEKVLMVNRSALNISHPKLNEILLEDFTQAEKIRKDIKGYDACFFCMGVTSIGMNEEDYTRITYNTAASFADVLFSLNPELVFNYVSGASTDSTEKGKVMWARVKGKTENYILYKGFKDAFAFRPGFIIPEKGVSSRTKFYNILIKMMVPFYPLFRKFKSITSTEKIGLAMINTLRFGLPLKHLENRDINLLADRKF